MLSFKYKKIGIWGLGLVGKSAVKFFNNNKAAQLNVMDRKSLLDEEKKFLHDHNATFISQINPEQFFNEHDLILASPGVDVRPYRSYHHKLITELDLIQHYCTKPIIAITGTIAKTTVTHTLGALLQKKKQVLVGGNIGTPMLDLLTSDNNVYGLVLEVSSFQLEFIRTFAPSLAIWTTFYPNHLDRHTNVQEYFNTKYNLIQFQQPQQHALLPLSIAHQVLINKPRSTLAFFSEKKPIIDRHLHNKQLFWIEDNFIMHYKNHSTNPIFPINNLPDTGFLINWLIIVAALKLLEQPLTLLKNDDSEIISLEHRLEWCGSINEIDFYNDSKSTIMESTVAAVSSLSARPIILLLGGLSKGVNRKQYYAQLKNNVKCIICFGQEADQLAAWAQEYAFTAIKSATLDEAIQQAINCAQSGDQILLSPGGSSYDLFKDYKERGIVFKNLVKQLTK